MPHQREGIDTLLHADEPYLGAAWCDFGEGRDGIHPSEACKMERSLKVPYICSTLHVHPLAQLLARGLDKRNGSIPDRAAARAADLARAGGDEMQRHTCDACISSQACIHKELLALLSWQMYGNQQDLCQGSVCTQRSGRHSVRRKVIKDGTPVRPVPPVTPAKHKIFCVGTHASCEVKPDSR